MIFDTETGYMERWGKTKEDDPQMCILGPEILDLECGETCSGISYTPGDEIVPLTNDSKPFNGPCKFCYKSNTANKGKNMLFETFKAVLDNMTYKESCLCQAALGIGDIDGNPDLWKMMEYSRSKNIIPNITINGARMTPQYYDLLAKYCGAVSVSFYGNKTVCYEAIEELAKRGMKQINIHCMISEETMPWCEAIIEDFHTDQRLTGLNAVVFLSLKQKGRGVGFTPINQEKYKELVKKCLDKNIRFGFDSCGANKFIKAAKELEKPELEVYAEPCESGCFSSYVNVEGKFFMCSFCEDITEGIDVVNCEDFPQEIWFNQTTTVERNKIINNNRNCPYFEV